MKSMNGWFGGMEEELMFEDDDLNWDDVATAVGVEEPIKKTGSTSSPCRAKPSQLSCRAWL